MHKVDMERDVKKIVREISLRPLSSRSRPIELPDFTYKRLAVSDEVLKDVAQLAASGKLEEIFTGDDDASIKMQVIISNCLHLSGRMSWQEFVFTALNPLEMLFERRYSQGRYQELKRIEQDMRRVEKTHGLGDDEFWFISDSPPEYKKLNTEYTLLHEALFIDLLEEFELSELAELYRDDPEEFARIRERGRRHSSHKNEWELIVEDIVIRFEEDAKRAAGAKAFSAAVVLLGAALEGILLVRCLKSKDEAAKVSRELPRKKRPRNPVDCISWTFNNLIEVCSSAGWLPQVSTDYGKLNSKELANFLRRLRNNIHPGRYCKDRPWIEIDKHDFIYTYSVYLVLLSELIEN
ncbi:MAG: hypothetical protein D3911_10310 [Candidatus Electrothrix sp. AW3_4]|nr:hypothetical protein [Candidatus Electrothrix gigas]